MVQFNNQKKLFGNEWLSKARNTNLESNCYARNIIEKIDTSGQVYLNNIILLFDEFPANPKDKNKLRTQLECFDNTAHLGGVNELTLWDLMRSKGIKINPEPTAKEPRPDFKLTNPDCFVEVSTLNPSKVDTLNLNNGNGVELCHDETIKRIVKKITDEKLKQISYANTKNKPAVLVLFDYTAWSGFGTEFFYELRNFLFDKNQCGFNELPIELSAIVYLERYVQDGQIKWNSNSWAVYYNPMAKYPLPFSFPFLKQFSLSQ